MNCSLCGSTDTVQFLDLGQQPLANKYPKEADFKTEDFFPEKVFFCPRCKNVQLGIVVSRERMFEDYYYLSSVNPGLVRHFDALAETLKNKKFVVDVGSNDGILLKPLKELGVRALGVEPSINVSKIANDAGLETKTSFFDVKAAREIAASRGKADVIIASSVFTHLEDPKECIEAVKQLLAEDGEFIIEVEYIGDIVRQIQFERFYLDRVFYYSLTSLDTLLRKLGMYVSDVLHIEPHGGSLRVTARLGSGNGSEEVRRYIEEEKKTLTLETLRSFAREVDAQISAFRDALKKYKAEGVKVAGYGAPARVTTICNYGHIGPELISYIIDDSPLKQNKFSPGTHIPIKPFAYLAEHKPDLFVVFAYEYFDDIKKKTRGAYRYLIPIPPREIP